MKVGFLTSNHLPEARGGTEQVVDALERQLRSLDVTTFAITSSDVPHFGTDHIEENVDGVVVHRLFKRDDEWDHRGFERPRLLGLVRELLTKEHPDVLHVHSTAALGTGCIGVARELGIPVLMTFHDLWPTCARYFRLPAPGITCPTGTDRTSCIACVDGIMRAGPDVVAAALAERDRLVRADIAQVNACTAPSQTTARTIADCLPHDGAIEVVPHGLLHAVSASERSPGPRPGERLRVGSFGGLGEEKGIPELLAALAGLPCELHLAGRHGGEWLTAAVTRLEASGVPVVLAGEYGPTDPHPARAIDLAVFPSKCQETYGLVVDEALAHGVPCVVSDHGALAERAEHPGVVVTALANLRATLHDLASSPDHVTALRRAIPAELPSIRAAATRYLELYRSIA
ncbi:MAG: glycosyltransferase [bacterium]|nr:glycosyltransferase [bacterium]